VTPVRHHRVPRGSAVSRRRAQVIRRPARPVGRRRGADYVVAFDVFVGVLRKAAAVVQLRSEAQGGAQIAVAGTGRKPKCRTRGSYSVAGCLKPRVRWLGESSLSARTSDRASWKPRAYQCGALTSSPAGGSPLATSQSWRANSAGLRPRQHVVDERALSSGSTSAASRPSAQPRAWAVPSRSRYDGGGGSGFALTAAPPGRCGEPVERTAYRARACS
jgi:hypothetical protein